MVNLLYIPPLFNDPEVLSSASDKAKLFAKNFSKNSNPDDLGISLPVFSSISNLNLHKIFITHEMVKKVLTNLCSSKASGPDCNNNRSGVLIQLMHPRRSTEFGKLVLFTSLGLVEFQVRNLALFLLFSVIGGFWWFWMGSLHKNIQFMLEFLKGPVFSPTLFLLYINDLPDDVICNIPIYADNTTLCSKCDWASDLWQQLELASELESDLRDTVDWGRKWLDFNAGKTQLVLFDRANNTGAIDVNRWVYS